MTKPTQPQPGQHPERDLQRQPPKPDQQQKAPPQQPTGDYSHGHPGVPPEHKEKAR